MSVVLQHDSRVNVTYAYHNECIWDKASKKAGAKRTLIGIIKVNIILCNSLRINKYSHR